MSEFRQFCVAHSQALTQADAATAAQRRTAGVSQFAIDWYV